MPLHSPQALVAQAGVTPLGPWGPMMDCPVAEGAGQDVLANEPHLDMECTVLSGGATISRLKRALLPSQGHPSNGGCSGLEEL